METIVFGYRQSLHPEFRNKKLDELLEGGFVAAVNHSGWFGQWFEQDIKNQFAKQLIHAEGTERRMSMLMLSRVDMVIGDQEVLLNAAKKLAIDDFAIGLMKINQAPVHFMFSQHSVSTAFVTEFDQHLRAHIHQADEK